MAEKHIVVQGATCQCKFSVEPKTDVLKVKTQTKHFANDKDGEKKLIATHKDIGQTFEKNTFGKCKMQPNGSGDFLPCQAIVTQWAEPYDKITFEENAGNPLLEDSKATCPIGGPDCISIKNHGQTGEGSAQQIKQGDNIAQNQANPVFANFPESQKQAKAEEREIGPEEKREIVKLETYDINDKLIPKGTKFHYGKVVNTTVHTTGMVGETIHIELWEDDATGAGHSDENRYNKVDEQLAKVGEKGIAEVQFTIKPSFAKIATAHNAKEGKTHEYYFLAYGAEVINTSANINIYAPEYKEEKNRVIEQKLKGIEPKPVQEPKQKIKALPEVEIIRVIKRPKPATATPAVKEPKKITYIYFTDDKNNKITKASYDGSMIRAHFGSTGLIGHKVKMRMYDHEVMGNAHFLDETPEFTIKKSPCYVNFALNEKLKERGANLFSDDVYVDIEIMETKAHVVSTKIEVATNNSIIDIAKNITKSKVGKEEKKEEKKSNCPNCDKDITLAEIKKICVDSKDKCLITDDAMITAALPHLNTYRKKVGINTCVRKAHFLAQIAHESKFQTLQEIFNYHWQIMIGKFSSYFKQFKTQEEKETEAKRLGRANLAASPGLTLDEQMKLANAIYGSTHPNGKLHTAADDGWRYSGKGFKQITWKGNYDALQKYFNKNMKVNGEADVVWVDGDNPYKLKNNGKDAMTSALAFWAMNGINGVATKINYESVNSVTRKINPGMDGEDERKRYFKKAVEVLKTDECKPKGDLKLVAEKGTVVVMSGIFFKLGTEKTKAGKQWNVYKTSVYQNMSLETYKTQSNKNELPTANYITYLSRDAHNKSENRSAKRYGSLNEAPPGTYYLNKHSEGQLYYIYLGDSQGVGESGISGGDGWRGGIAIHGGWPEGTEGCLTTHSANYGNIEKGQPINPLVQELINNIPDFENNTDDKPVRFIIEERVATKNGKIWNGESI